jgi:hypothetical protein
MLNPAVCVSDAWHQIHDVRSKEWEIEWVIEVCAGEEVDGGEEEGRSGCGGIRSTRVANLCFSDAVYYLKSSLATVLSSSCSSLVSSEISTTIFPGADRTIVMMFPEKVILSGPGRS